MIALVQGPVRPLVQQGSSVTYRIAPLAFSPAFFSATTSAWSRRSYTWNPWPITRSFFTRTAPTIGFGCARASPRPARVSARSIGSSSASRIRPGVPERTGRAACGVKTPEGKAGFLSSELKLRPPKFRAERFLVEERVDIGLRVEGDEVVDFFAGADEADREIQFAGDGDDDAALRRAVQLR